MGLANVLDQEKSLVDTDVVARSGVILVPEPMRVIHRSWSTTRLDWIHRVQNIIRKEAGIRISIIVLI